jgi:hypothetical protein
MSKTALITGASSGIGREFAKLFAKDGYDLVIVARGREALEKVREQIQEHHKVQVKIFDRDLSQTHNISEIYGKLLEEKIEIDVLVNNAGFGDFGKFHERDWDRQLGMVQVNVIAVMQLTRLLLPHMVKRGNGKILNVASNAAFQPGPLMAVYYATKAFVLSFSEAISNELEGTGVTVTTLCPGPTATHFQTIAGVHNTRLFRTRVLPHPKEVALFGYKAMQNKRRVVVHGWYNKFIVFIERFSPRWLTLRLTRYVQENVKQR